jgi:hypothetical protein
MTMKQATIQQPLLGNGFTYSHECNNSTATNAMQQKSSVFYAVHAEML